MYSLIKGIVSVLTGRQRKQIFLLQVLVVFSSIFEVMSVLAIGPFMAMIGNMSLIETNLILNKVYVWSGLSDKYEFIITAGIIVLIFMLVSAISSIITIKRLSFFAAKIGADFGDRLYSLYMSKDYLYHTSINSSELVKKISVEVTRVTDNVLQPLVQINARVVTVILITTFVFIYNPYVALAGVLILFIAYFVMYRIVRNRLLSNGERISIFSKKRFSLMNEGFGAIKEVQLLGKQGYFINQFIRSGEVFAQAYGSSNSLYNMPRYIMEFVVYSSMVGLILILLINHEGNLTHVLPVMGVFGMAAFKLLPSFQQIYSGLAQIRSNVSAFNSIQSDLFETLYVKSFIKERGDDRLLGDVVLTDLNFSYPSVDNLALKNVNLVIPYKNSVGIVGPSGSGKSTIFDILIGVLPTEQGSVKVGGNEITRDNVGAWQNSIGYVSQMTLIKDGTIAENIAFGIESNSIDRGKLISALNNSQLADWVENLPQGLDTKVGERGLQISGGQRQRIAIARALYNNADYLFFDEATSALDSITEKSIMKSIENMAGNKTIVMIAHRLNTVKNCSIIYVVDDGVLKDSGTYEELFARNSMFTNMAGMRDE